MRYSKGIRFAAVVVFLVGLLSSAAGCTKPPVAGIEAYKTKAAVGEAIQFSNTSTGEITSWTWDFGDGNTSAEENPSHAYGERGRYTASLTVSNKAGSSIDTLPITVLQPPAANFTASETMAHQGSSIRFSDDSSGDIDSWSWDFGDGGSSTEQNPSHEYKDAGKYTVSLTVSNAASSDTREKQDYINIKSFIISRIEICSKVTEYGEYTVQPDATFHRGDRAWIYFEAIGFENRKNDGKYEIWIEFQSFKVYGPDGKALFSYPGIFTLHETVPEMLAIVWLNAWINTVRNMAIGEYKAEVKIEDKLSGETAEESISFFLE